MPSFFHMDASRLRTIGARAVSRLLAFGILGGFAVLGVNFGIALARQVGQPEQLGLFFAIPAVSIALILLVFAHECGHAVAAVLLGWRLFLFTAWRLTIKFDPFRVHWGHSPFGGARWGAIAALPATGRICRSEWITILAGGITANMFIAILAGIFLLENHAPLLTSICTLVGSLSLLLLISNLIPTRSAISRNDGALLLDAIRGEDLVAREHYTLLFSETVKGRRPRDWNPKYIEDVRKDLVGHRPDAYQYLLLSEWHFDRGEHGDARRMLECAKTFDKSGKAFLIPDALLLALIERDGSAALELLARVTPKRARMTFGYWLAMGAGSLATGNEQSAKKDLERAEDALRRFPLSTEADWELLRSLQSKTGTLASSLPAQVAA